MRANFDVNEKDLLQREISMPEKIRRIAIELLESDRVMVEVVDSDGYYRDASALYQATAAAIRKKGFNRFMGVHHSGVSLEALKANGRVFIRVTV